MQLTTYTEIAEHYGKSKRQVSNWKNKGAPIFPGGISDTDEIDDWLQNQEGIRTKSPDALPQRSTAEVDKIESIRLKRAKRKLAQYDLQIKQGKLIAFEDVKQSQMRMANEIRRQLEVIPGTYKDHILNLKSANDGEKILKKIIEDVLVLLHRGGK